MDVESDATIKAAEQRLAAIVVDAETKLAEMVYSAVQQINRVADPLIGKVIAAAETILDGYEITISVKKVK